MLIPDEYFLTPKTKRRELRYLKEAISKGDIDKRMLPYLKTINKIAGVISESCCSGHTKRERGIQVDDGYLFVSISKEKYYQLFFNRWTPYIWSGPKYGGGISQQIFDDKVMVMFRWHRSCFKKAMKETIEFLRGPR